MSLKLLSRDFAFYGVLDFLQRSVSILLVPIYTRVLTQSNYGNLDLILTVWGALTVLADLQFTNGFARFYLEHRRAGDGPRFVGSTLVTRIAAGAVLAAAFLAFGYAGLLEVSFIPSFLRYKTVWTIAVVGIPIAYAFEVLLMQAQMLRWKRWFVAGSLGNVVLSTILCVVFVVVLRMGIEGVVLGQFLGTFASTCALFVGLRPEISFRYNRRIVTTIAGYSLPLVPGRWMNHSSGYVSRFFVYAALGANENAILAITTKLAAVLGLFCVAFRTAWQPLAMAYIGDEMGERFFVRASRLFTAGGVFSIFALAVLSRPMLAILAPPSYAIAEYYLPLFLVGGIIGELDVNFQLGNQISKKTYWISVSSALELLTNVLILALLTPRIGIYAAGLGVLAASMAKAMLTYFTAQRNHNIHYDVRSLLVFTCGCVLLLVLSFARSTHAISDAVYYVNAVLFGLALPWLTLAASDRQIVKDYWAAGLHRSANHS